MPIYGIDEPCAVCGIDEPHIHSKEFALAMKARPYTPTDEFIPKEELDAHLEHDPSPALTAAAAIHGTFACPICGLSTPHFHDIDPDDPTPLALIDDIAEPDILPPGLTLPEADILSPGLTLPEPEFQTAFDDWAPKPLEPLPEPPAVGEIELFMPEDIAHAVKIYREAHPDNVGGSDIGQIRGLRAVMMFALQVAAVNLGVHPDPQPTHVMHGKIQSKARAKAQAGRKANQIRRKKGYPKS